MQRPEDADANSRIKRGKDEDRFYCPYPGCTRSFAELWRLKVHYRAPPDVRGSGKERGHGTELQFCPKCGKELKPGKHHVGCFAGRVGPRQAVKRARDEDLASEVSQSDDAPGVASDSARQRPRTCTVPEIKSEDVLPRAGSLNRFSEEAASLTRSGWHGEYNLNQDTERQHQQQHELAVADMFDPKNSTDQFTRYQQMLPSLRRPSRSLQGFPSAPSPPPSPPGDLDAELANMQPLFDFGLFSSEHGRGRNTRLPVAVTSTLHADVPLAPDNRVLQALLGEATSFAASSANQLPSAAAEDRQRIQNALAQQRIEQVAASAQELLRNQGPPYPSHSSNRFPSPPQNLPSAFDFNDRDSMALASLLQQPNQFVSSMEHYEPLGSGRPGRMHGQHTSFQQPSQGWTHRPVPSRRLPDFASGPSPLPSPPALINTQQHDPTPSSLQSALPWDLRWGGLPTNVEPNVAQGFRLREQLQQAQQQQQAQRQGHQQQQQGQQQRHMAHSPCLGAAAMEAAQHSSDSGFRHLTSDPQQPRTFTFLPSSRSAQPQGGFRDHMGSPFQSTTPFSGGLTEPYGFPGSSLGNGEAGNEAFWAHSRRLLRQEAPNQDLLQLPWSDQEFSLFDRMGGVSPVDASNTVASTAPDMSLPNPTHARYASAAELGQPDPLSRLASPELQPGLLSGWSQASGGGLLDHIRHAPKQGIDHAQVPSHAASLGSDDRLLTRQQQQPPQQHVPTTAHQQ